MAGKAWDSQMRAKMAQVRLKLRKKREEVGLPDPASDYPYEDRQELQRQGYAPHEDPDTYD